MKNESGRDLFASAQEAEGLRLILLHGGIYYRVRFGFDLIHGHYLIGYYKDREGEDKAMNIYPHDEPRFLAFAINPLGNPE